MRCHRNEQTLNNCTRPRAAVTNLTSEPPLWIRRIRQLYFSLKCFLGLTCKWAMVEAVFKFRTNKVVCSENVIESLDTDLCRLECLNVSLVSASLYVKVCSGNERNYDRLRRFNAILHKVVELPMPADNKTDAPQIILHTALFSGQQHIPKVRR